MDIKYFLNNCSWVLEEDDGDYHMALETNTHSVDVFIKPNNSTTYEAYNELDDSSVVLNDEELKQIKNFIFNNYDKTRSTKTQI